MPYLMLSFLECTLPFLMTAMYKKNYLDGLDELPGKSVVIPVHLFICRKEKRTDTTDMCLTECALLRLHSSNMACFGNAASALVFPVSTFLCMTFFILHLFLFYNYILKSCILCKHELESST